MCIRDSRFSPPLGARKLFVACKNFDRALVPTSASPSLSPPSTFALAFDARFGSVVIVVVVSSAVVSSIVVLVVVVDMMMDDSIARGNELHRALEAVLDAIHTHRLFYV